MSKIVVNLIALTTEIFTYIAFASTVTTIIALIAVVANADALTAVIAATFALASAIATVINNAVDLISAIALCRCLGHHHSHRSHSHCLCCHCCHIVTAIALLPLSAGGHCHTSAVLFAKFFYFFIVDCLTPRFLVLF
jgi:hypothetical protein